MHTCISPKRMVYALLVVLVFMVVNTFVPIQVPSTLLYRARRRLSFMQLKRVMSDDIFFFRDNDVGLIRRLEFNEEMIDTEHVFPSLLEADTHARELKQQTGVGYTDKSFCGKVTHMNSNSTAVSGLAPEIRAEATQMLLSFQDRASEYLAESIVSFVTEQCLNTTSQSSRVLCGPDERAEVEALVKFVTIDGFNDGKRVEPKTKDAPHVDGGLSSLELFSQLVGPMFKRVWNGHSIEAFVAVLFMIFENKRYQSLRVTVSKSEILKEISMLTKHLHAADRARISRIAFALIEEIHKSVECLPTSRESGTAIFSLDPHVYGQWLAIEILKTNQSWKDESSNTMQQVSDRTLSAMYGFSESNVLYVRFLCSVALEQDFRFGNLQDQTTGVNVESANECNFQLMTSDGMVDFLHSAAWTLLTQATHDIAQKIGDTAKLDTKKDIDSLLDMVGSLCALNPDLFTIYNCFHGVGHGVLRLYKEDIYLIDEYPVHFKWNEDSMKMLANARQDFIQQHDDQDKNEFNVELIRGCARTSYGFQRNINEDEYGGGRLDSLDIKRMNMFQAHAMAACVFGIMHGVEVSRVSLLGIHAYHKRHLAQSLKYVQQNDLGLRHLISLLLDHNYDHTTDVFYEILYDFNMYLGVSEAYLEVLMDINDPRDPSDTKYKKMLVPVMNTLQQVLIGFGLTFGYHLHYFWPPISKIKKISSEFYFVKDRNSQLNRTSVIDYLINGPRIEIDDAWLKTDYYLRALKRDVLAEDGSKFTINDGPNFMADFCHIPETGMCSRICKQRQDKDTDSCLSTCSSIYSNSVRPLCWSMVGARTYGASKLSCSENTDQEPSLVKVLNDQSICLLLCRKYKCTRRDYDYCILGYLNISMFNAFHIGVSLNWDPKLFHLLGRKADPTQSEKILCAMLEDQLLRQVCDYLFYSKSESMKREAGSSIIGTFNNDHYLRDLDPTRWQDTAPPRLLWTSCMDDFR